MRDISEAAPARRTLSRRWLLLAGAFVAFSVSIGTMQSYTVFLLAFITAFGWDRAETSLAYSVSQLVSGASSPVVGILVDRFGPRRLLLFGTALLVTGLVASSYATALWHVVLLYGFVMTFGSTCLGLVVFVPILSRYFARRRGMAISIVQSANGFGRGGSTPAAEYLIAQTYVTDIEEFFRHAETRMRYFGPASPTSTTVEVRRLAGPDFLVEISAIAVIDDKTG